MPEVNNKAAVLKKVLRKSVSVDTGLLDPKRTTKKTARKVAKSVNEEPSEKSKSRPKSIKGTHIHIRVDQLLL